MLSFRFSLLRFTASLLGMLLCGWAIHSLWFASLPRADLAVGPHQFRAVVAETPRSQEWGLMFRFSLGEDAMLFAYPKPSTLCLWMKYTFIPLSVAFIRQDGVVVELSDMQPFSHESHCPSAPVSYALEVSQGWFQGHAIAPGAIISGLP
jgi:uncharacterized membrane protein (UPF0127 family)